MMPSTPNTPKVVSEAELERSATAIVAAYMSSPQRRLLVAIAGRPGSGKSTVAKYLASRVRRVLETASTDVLDRAATAVVVMPMDGYHLYKSALHAMPNREEAVRRRGAEWTFDPRKMCRDLQRIRLPASAPVSGVGYDDVCVPSFDHGVGDPVEGDIVIPGAARVVIVEGNYLLFRGTPAWAEVHRCFDYTIFLACPAEGCARRLCRRHMAAWGISEAAAMQRATGSDAINGDLVDTTRGNAMDVLHSIECEPSHL